jgi:hypothetical protein
VNLFKIDTSEMDSAIMQLLPYTSKGVSQLINQKVGWVLRKTLWNTKKADFEKIKRELGVELKQVMGRRGKPLKRMKLAVNDKYYKQLSTLIVVSRLRKKGEPIPSKSKLKSMAVDLVRAKVRSVAFLKSGVATALKPFLKFCSGKAGGPPPSNDERAKTYGEPKGWGSIATDNTNGVFHASGKFILFTKRRTDRKGRTSGGNTGAVNYVKPALEAAFKSELTDTKQRLNDVLFEAARKVGISAKK